MRDELVGPTGAPSVVDVEERLQVQSQVASLEHLNAVTEQAYETLQELSESLVVLREQLKRLEDETENNEDRRKAEAFRTAFREQLQAYGFRSVSPVNVTIDENSFLPISDGFELSFDLNLGSSASDAVRSKWAYHAALLEVGLATGNHPGLLVLDVLT
ncbi:hypothetical protein MMUR_28310 [Mycolicibacterium murale]|uniref:Uncharacterized protein n=1 Tax=Mycolicibacterium murale TaxID=182220 RepID=A0A7I9WLU2_9MYCO|nr:hypothetical protein [Mycolicibacterium murale]MCV7181721.1 hypothetical protein [Mycolicibacterium murale]GFG58695.1 hypothetical protein MMUR_28310 [Mycolicibacterium murale]